MKRMDINAASTEYSSAELLRIEANARKRALKSGIVYELPAGFVADRMRAQDMRCALSGLPLARLCPPGSFRRPFVPSIDRLDSRKGYTTRNCVIVCCIANAAKNEWPIWVLESFCVAFVARRSNDQRLERFTTKVVNHLTNLAGGAPISDKFLWEGLGPGQWLVRKHGGALAPPCPPHRPSRAIARHVHPTAPVRHDGAWSIDYTAPAQPLREGHYERPLLPWCDSLVVPAYALGCYVRITRCSDDFADVLPSAVWRHARDLGVGPPFETRLSRVANRPSRYYRLSDVRTFLDSNGFRYRVLEGNR